MIHFNYLKFDSDTCARTAQPLYYPDVGTILREEDTSCLLLTTLLNG